MGPPFDDEEPPLDFSDHLLDIDVNDLEGVQMELDEYDDMFIKDWFYNSGPRPLGKKEHWKDSECCKNIVWINGPSYKKWRLGTPILANLYRLAAPILGTKLKDANFWHLFNLDHFLTAKALN